MDPVQHFPTEIFYCFEILCESKSEEELYQIHKVQVFHPAQLSSPHVLKSVTFRPSLTIGVTLSLLII
jgi:hypothetical protein